MFYLTSHIAALEAWFKRRTYPLQHPRAVRVASMTVPLLFGLLSLLLGQDSNWDLRNYHLYNAYALLNDRLALDMAPGNWQSYFNPALDIPYFLLVTRFPGPVAGFVFGVLHGVNFVLVLAIARQLLDRDPDGKHPRVPLLLAAAGTCGAGFLSELGNTMGDNMTSLLVLSALYITLRHWDTLQQGGRTAALAALGAGMVMGLAAGLKLTNVSYAAALCLAYLVLPIPIWPRLRLACVAGIGVVTGIAITAGHWLLKMWQFFGNPLYPQFNSIFRSPLAQQVGVIDVFHLPKDLGETLLWPMVFTVNFERVSELALKQTIWPVLYLLFIAAACYWLYTRCGGKDDKPALSPRARFLLLFFGLAYLGWMQLFSIYRYLIPIELLAPLVLWILLQRIVAPLPARRAAAWILIVTSLAVFPFVTWGHSPWAKRSFSAAVPPIPKPASTIVFTAHGHPPMGWLAMFFPKEVSVISLGSGMPESPAYVARINAVIARRPGPHYVMLAASTNRKQASTERKRKVASSLGLTGSARGCAALTWLLPRVRFQLQLTTMPAPVSGQHCMLELPRTLRLDLPALDRTIASAAADKLRGYGLAVDTASCRVYPARIGAEPYPYQLCSVTVQPELRATFPPR